MIAVHEPTCSGQDGACIIPVRFESYAFVETVVLRARRASAATTVREPQKSVGWHN